MGETILVVAAHADDEVLGCGGALAWHSARGDRVEIIIVADGETSRGGGADISARKAAVQCASEIMGAGSPVMLNLPDNRLDSMDLLDIVKKIEMVVDDIQPTIVYTHHGGDLNIDHATVCRAVLTACRPFPEQTVRAIYGFEVLSSTDWAGSGPGEHFMPTRFLDITKTQDTKRKALECYASEMRPFPHARSMETVEALARLRGSNVGLQAAEAFTVLRQIVTE